MSDNTPRLGLPELAQMQEMDSAQINEALLQLDALGGVFLRGLFVNTPPASPTDGDTYVTGGAPTGVWSGYTYKLAYCIDGAWRFFNPFNGLIAYLATASGFVVYRDGQWTALGALLAGPEASLASAATCDLASAGAMTVCVTGITTITSFGGGINKLCLVRFAQALTLTHDGVGLMLLGGASRITAANDVGLYRSDASGNWRELSYTRAAIAPDSYVTLSATQTLTGKTLSGVTISGTTTLPGSGVISSSGALGIGGATAASTMLRIASATTAMVGQNTVLAGSQSGGAWTAFAINAADNGANANSIDWTFTSIGAGTGPSIAGYRTSSTAADLSFSATNSDARAELIRLQGAGKRVGILTTSPSDTLDVNGNVVPHADNSFNLGSASLRWSTVYAGTGSINISDAALKTNLRALSGAEMAVAKALAGQVQVFQFCDAVAKKGDAARLHAGALFQGVCDAFAAHGLDPRRYGIVCEDALVDGDGAPVLNSDGTPRMVCGLRYDELAQFVLAGLAARIAALEAA